MRRRTFVTAIGGGTAAGSTMAAAGSAGTATQRRPVGEALLRPEAIDPSTRELQINIAPNGDADWTLTFGVDLSDDEAAAAFEQIEEDPSAVQANFEEQLDAVLATAQPTVDREITIGSPEVSTTRPRDGRGEMVVEFRWTQFAWVDGEDLVVDDLLGADLLAAAEPVTIAWPEGYEVAVTTPQPTEQSDQNRLLVWEDGSTAGEDGLTLRLSTGADGLPLWFAGGTMGGVLLIVFGVFYLFGRSSRTRTPEQRDRGQKPFESVSDDES